MKRLFLLLLLVFAVGEGVARAQFRGPVVRIESAATTLQREVEPLYRKPSKKELKTVEPGRELFDRYADFLRQSKTGLTKLIGDKGCADNTKVLVVTEDCLKYTMPGAGSSFSFRTENYRIARLADLTYTDKSFQASGVLLHGILVNLGDVPLDKAALTTRGMKFLVEFQPEPDYRKSKELDARLIRGVEDDGFLYRRGLFTVENATFALRSIAYDGQLLRSVKGVVYNEFDYDRRKDVIVVFRIVDKDAAGDVTILWKILQEKDSPEMRKSSN
ncbi:MAG: hypothetical protein JSS81_13445 [Acidobacteria bacterium]|nr:hypothetical protein [Acidobacteriota bacterium]